jgi:hypothetical protein
MNDAKCLKSRATLGDYIVPLFPMKLEDHRIIFYTYQLLVLKPPNHGLVFRIVDLQSSSVPSPLVNYTNREEKKQEEDEDKNRVHYRKNIDLDSRLQI